MVPPVPINDRLAALTAYPFARLTALLDGTPPGAAPVAMSVGEPQHAAPPLLAESLAATAPLWHRYPPVAGSEDFRAATAGWLERRYGLPAGSVDRDTGPVPLSGTREGLFMAALLAVPPRKAGQVPAVCLPNPFYAAYEGAAVMAGAEPVFLETGAETGFLPDLDALSPALLERIALFYLCSPTNPQGGIADIAYLRRLIGMARRHGFVLAVDECYAEIYDREAPPGALQAAAGMDGGAVDNLLVFHSLSKRSNAAGLRSGFVAGDPRLLAGFARLRGYAAAGMPLPIQAASAALWRDDAHVAAIRDRYRGKIDLAEAALADTAGFRRPAGGFFLWLDLGPEGDGEATALALWREAGIRVLPGAYLTRPGDDGINRGRCFIRVALVHDEPVLALALPKLAAFLTTDTSARAYAAVGV
ncbi:MAG: aminotransferase class I/II-fold pyridoxal phosphate-dependent enzyme [Inquilinus sp.]|nr:aminotransferase class I/II-fold pyridoxal phosphate-dependent enzyme [Inquilinus sp.]